DIRQLVLRRAAREARDCGTAVELVTAGDRGEHRLLVDTEGAFSTPGTDDPDGGTGRHSLGMDTDGKEVSEQTPRPVPAVLAEGPAVESPARASFLTPSTYDSPRPHGWRAALSRIGIHLRPSAAQRRRAEWTATVARQWAGCRTLAVVNGKGGVGKTMTCAMLAAVYAREGGGN